MLRTIATFLLVLIAPIGLLAQQNVKFTSSNFKGRTSDLNFALQKIKEGDGHLKAEEYDIALPYYISADSLNHDNADLNTKIGICYLNSKNFYKGRCLRYFRKGYALDKNISKRMPFFLARGYHLNYLWDSAIMEYTNYLPKADPKDKKDIPRFIEQCNSGKELMQHPVYAKLENLGPNINSPYREYAPFLTVDESEIVFTSRRPNTVGGFFDPGTGEYFEDIYISHYKDGQWEPAENIGPPINSNDNDATAYLTPNGQRLFIFRDVNNGDFYVSNFSSNGWSDPKPLPGKVNTPYHESTLCLSPDGKTLYFVSDKPGGKGGRDIYRSYLQPDSSWGEPINMGDTINTQYDEEGVFIHPDGKTMYFSSKGHNSMGGYDIFKSVYDSGRWGVPQNLGYPINTPDDDVFFIVSASGKHGYFASAQDTGGYGGLDIYRVEMEAFKPRLVILKGVVLDSVTRAPLPASITLMNRSKNMTMPFNSNATTGAYLLSLPSGEDYEIQAHAEGYPDYSFNISVADTTTYREIVKNIALLKPGTVVTKSDTVKPVVAVSGDTCTPDMATLLRLFNGFTSDTAALQNMVKHLDNDICLKKMMFTVQIGAYHFPRNFKYKKVEIKPVAINDFPDGITRFTMGSFGSYSDAMEFKKVVVEKGVKDAWITGIYHGKRVVLEQLLHPKS